MVETLCNLNVVKCNGISISQRQLTNGAFTHAESFYYKQVNVFEYYILNIILKGSIEKLTMSQVEVLISCSASATAGPEGERIPVLSGLYQALFTDD